MEKERGTKVERANDVDNNGGVEAARRLVSFDLNAIKSLSGRVTFLQFLSFRRDEKK